MFGLGTYVAFRGLRRVDLERKTGALVVLAPTEYHSLGQYSSRKCDREHVPLGEVRDRESVSVHIAAIW